MCRAMGNWAQGYEAGSSAHVASVQGGPGHWLRRQDRSCQRCQSGRQGRRSVCRLWRWRTGRRRARSRPCRLLQAARHTGFQSTSRHRSVTDSAVESKECATAMRRWQFPVRLMIPPVSQVACHLGRRCRAYPVCAAEGSMVGPKQKSHPE